MNIVVDAMGGDHAPGAPVAGALAAAREFGVGITLVGPAERLRQELAARRGQADGVRVIDAPEVIGSDESPVRAVRRKSGSSLVVGMNLVKTGQADGLVSAGSSGALLAAGVFVLGRLPGIDRPAFGAAIPTRKGTPVLLLDVGVNVDNRPEHLLQFAIMGRVYAQQVMGIAEPRVGLLNNGTEAEKGNNQTKAAHALLQRAHGLGFIGHVEGRDIPFGGADVIVADGFVGNVALKVYEGVALALMGTIKDAFTSSPLARVGALLARPALRRLARKLDYAETGGAPILGLVAPVVKCHGSSNDRAVKNGIGVLRDLIAGRAIDRVAEGLAQVEGLMPKPDTKGDAPEDD